MGEILRRGTPCGCGVALLPVVPEFREYVRASTTALNAALLPLMGAYMGAVTSEVAAEGVTVPLHLMQTNGGVTPAARARELPIALSASGPAAGVIGGARLAALVGERAMLLTFDMGGTTADIGLVIDGEPERAFLAGRPPACRSTCPSSTSSASARAAARSRASTRSARSRRAGQRRRRPRPRRLRPAAARRRRSPTPTWCSALSRRGAWPAACRSTAGRAEPPWRAAVGEPLGLGVEEAAVAILRVATPTWQTPCA